jgi:meiotically up-regulated gene 157 (Mug157) protein
MRIVDVYACEQHHDRCSHYTHPELPEGGRGAGFTETGMLWSGFRPSDDPVRYPFNIPQQMLAAVALDELAVLAERGYGDVQLGLRARLLAAEVRAGIERYGRFYDFRYGWIYAYEVDGRGGVALMDDANLPSLLAAPYFGYVGSNDPVYRNTRAFVLSRDNPYYYRGRFAEGVGSAHTPANWVWPLALIARALTASSVQETASELAALARTDDEDGLVHESFDPNAYWKFTRTEFGWANAMYAELLFSRATAFDRSPPTGAGETFFSISSSPHRMAPSRVVSIADGLQNSAAIMRALRRALPQ